MVFEKHAPEEAQPPRSTQGFLVVWPPLTCVPAAKQQSRKPDIICGKTASSSFDVNFVEVDKSINTLSEIKLKKKDFSFSFTDSRNAHRVQIRNDIVARDPAHFVGVVDQRIEVISSLDEEQIGFWNRLDAAIKPDSYLF